MLASDKADMHSFASQQFKLTEDGFILKVCTHWSAKTPKALVDGHKIHLAIEFSEVFKVAYKENVNKINYIFYENRALKCINKYVGVADIFTTRKNKLFKPSAIR